MKKIDQLLLKGFLPPFIITSFIALFVLIMQFLWTNIDDIVGKDAGLLVVMELISYLSISLIPTALPIAILIASVMLMGNLAERYELTSLQSAGIPLLRIMRPLMFLSLGIAMISFLCSSYVIPLANLQFKSRLYDIRKQKPALSLEAGVFNDDFKGFSILIGNKKEDKAIEDVIIYDHSDRNKEPWQIAAKHGEMYNTADGQFFIMTLYDGTQYQATKQATKGNAKTYPFSRTSFKVWNKVFNLNEFDLQRTNEEDFFQAHHSIMGMDQLRTKIDTLESDINRQLSKLGTQMDQSISILQEERPNVEASTLSKQEDTTHKAINTSPQKTIIPIQISKASVIHSSFIELLPNLKVKKQMVSKAQSYARNLLSQAKSTIRNTERSQEKRVKHIYELNIKYSMAFVCFIFLFIGAPMGAIIRKGGFGYPILIAIIFFMLYIVLNVFCKELAESMVISAQLAAWLSCIVLFPIGLLLSLGAMYNKVRA